MNNMMWLVRAARWARNPPSARMVRLVLGIVLAGVCILMVEKLGYWPDWATMERHSGPRLPR